MSLLAVVGFNPTIVKASTDISTLDLNYATYTGQGYLDFQSLSYGEWVSRGYVNLGVGANPEYGGLTNFEVSSSYFDHVDVNARLMYELRDVRWSADSVSNIVFDYIFSAQDTDWEWGSPSNVSSISVYGYVDNVWRILPCTSLVERESNRMNLSVTYFGGYNVQDIRVYINFNIDTYFGSSPFFSGSQMASLYLQVGYKHANFSEVLGTDNGVVIFPDLENPDIDSLPNIDGYLPDSSNPIVRILDLFYQQNFVLISMVCVAVLGAVSMVLFGRKK